MRLIILSFLVFFHQSAFSKTWTMDEEAEVKKRDEIKEPVRALSSVKKRKKPKRKVTAEPNRNLPDYAIYKGELGWGEIKGPIAKNFDDSYYIMNKVKTGDQFTLSLDNVIYAVEGKKIPVTGTVLSGELMGFNVLGHTVLEPYSKKLLIEFTSLVDEDGTEYQIKAYALRHGDQFFKPTRYISKKSKFLLGRVLSAFGASFLESRIQTNQSFLGQFQRNDAKSSGYAAGRDGAEVISNDFRGALNNSKDVAFIAQKMMYEIKFLNSPKTK